MATEKEKPIYIKEFYTLEQLNNEIKINTQSLRKFIKNGELVASKVGTRYVLKREDIINWLNNNKTNE